MAAVLTVLAWLALLAGSAVGASVAGAAAGAGGPLANPTSNRQPPYLSIDTGACTQQPGQAPKCQSPCFPHDKLVYNNSRACAKLLLTTTNAAQRAEKHGLLVLPSNYFGLSVTKQAFVLVNLERLSHGVPPLVGLSPYLSAAATAAAKKGEDPVFQTSYGPVKVWFPPTGGDYGFGGTWAGDSVNALAAMFGWMYDDGWGGNQRNTSNFVCTGPHAAGCWGHRDELLGEYTGTTCTVCIAGTGYSSPTRSGWSESYTVLIVRPVSPASLNFRWDGELKYLPAGWERTPAPGSRRGVHL